MALNLGLSWEKILPFTSFAEAEKVADAALSAKTQAAEARVSAQPLAGCAAGRTHAAASHKEGGGP